MRLYAAHSLTSYGTRYEARQLARLHGHFPSAEVLNPAAMFSSNEDWLEHWPGLLEQLGALAVFADQEGFIGGGVLLEVSGAIGAGLPVVALGHDGQLCHFGGFARGAGLIAPRSRLGRLLFGPPVSAGTVMAAMTARAAAPLGGASERCSCP